MKEEKSTRADRIKQQPIHVGEVVSAFSGGVGRHRVDLAGRETERKTRRRASETETRRDNGRVERQEPIHQAREGHNSESPTGREVGDEWPARKQSCEHKDRGME